MTARLCIRCRLPAIRRSIVCWVACLVVVAAGVPSLAAQPEDFFASAREQRAKYAAQLEGLAAWCDEHHLDEQAKKTRAWFRGQDPNKLYVADLPSTMGHAGPDEDAPPDVIEWDKRFWQLRRQYAATVDALARRAVRGAMPRWPSI